MCLAPRYISGMIAGPLSDNRNSASFDDTLCAPTGSETIAIKASASPAAMPVAIRRVTRIFTIGDLLQSDNDAPVFTDLLHPGCHLVRRPRGRLGAIAHSKFRTR